FKANVTVTKGDVGPEACLLLLFSKTSIRPLDRTRSLPNAFPEPNLPVRGLKRLNVSIASSHLIRAKLWGSSSSCSNSLIDDSCRQPPDGTVQLTAICASCST